MRIPAWACFVFFGVAFASLACGPNSAPADADLPPQSKVEDGPASGLPLANPTRVGMTDHGLALIRPAMQAYVADGRVAGVMTMVARQGHIVYWDAVGFRELATSDPLEPDDLFRIYSMTKPVTSVAVMMLVEEGVLSLDDPVSQFIPEFADVMVLTDRDERVPPSRPMTVEHLLSHTSGLTYGFFGDSPVDRLYRQSGAFTEATSLKDLMTRVAAQPLLASPGDRWNYSVSTDVLGRIIEVASGQPFDLFLRSRIFEPLRMEDTGFWVSAEKQARFAAHYRREDDELHLVESPTDGQYAKPPTWLSGGGGLVSTASDYIRFAQMLLNEGQLDDVRILAPETVRMMRTNRLPEALVPITLGTYLSSGYGFGLGFAVLVDEDASPEPDRNGVFRWAGAANTFFWIDPDSDLVGIVWTQFNPFAAYEIEREFQTLVYESLSDEAGA